MLRKSLLISFFLLLAALTPSLYAAVLGDVNNDNKVNLIEAVYALRVVSGAQTPSQLSIQQVIDNLPAEGGTVFIEAGVHLLSAGIYINKSNVTLCGEQGTVLSLSDHVKQPVILVGTDAQTPTSAHQIENIRICNLEINGNKNNQDSELDPSRTG